MIRTAGASAVVESMRRGASPESCYDIVQRILKKHPGVEGMQVGF